MPRATTPIAFEWNGVHVLAHMWCGEVDSIESVTVEGVELPDDLVAHLFDDLCAAALEAASRG